MPEYRSYTDDHLASLLELGDESAFTEIYNRYWNKLLAIAYNHTKDKSAAQEIVQEVFLSLWNKRTEVEIKSINNYLATAIKFTVFKSYYRYNKRQESFRAKLNSPIYHLEEELIDAKFLQDYINGIVETLPQKCKMVFKLSREMGLTIPEIADAMEISTKTAEAHLTKALKVVRLNLKNSGVISVIVLLSHIASSSLND